MAGLCINLAKQVPHGILPSFLPSCMQFLDMAGAAGVELLVVQPSAQSWGYHLDKPQKLCPGQQQRPSQWSSSEADSRHCSWMLISAPGSPALLELLWAAWYTLIQSFCASNSHSSFLWFVTKGPDIDINTCTCQIPPNFTLSRTEQEERSGEGGRIRLVYGIQWASI